MKSIYFLSSLSLLISISASAGTAQQLCRTYFEYLPRHLFFHTLDATLKALEQKKNPLHFSHIEAEILHTPAELHNSEGTFPTRSVVLSMGSPPEFLSTLHSLEFEHWIDVQSKRLGELQLDLSRALSGKTALTCEAALTEAHFQADEFQSLRKNLITVQSTYYSEPLEADARRQFNEVRGALELPWEWNTYSDINNLIALLDDDSVANLIILTHSNSEGELLDSYFNRIPKKLFSRISKGLMSLTFYTCKGKAVNLNYNVRELFQKHSSLFSERYFVTTDSQLDHQSATLDGFGIEMKRLDFFLSARLKKAHKIFRSSSQSSRTIPLCSLSSHGLKISRGAVGISINQTLVGVKNSEAFHIPDISEFPKTAPLDLLADDFTISFPCTLLQTHGATNTVYLQSIRYKMGEETETLVSPPFTLELQSPYLQELPHLEHLSYSHRAGEWIGTKYTLVLY